MKKVTKNVEMPTEVVEMKAVKDETPKTPSVPKQVEEQLDESLIALSVELTAKANVEFEKLAGALTAQKAETAKKQGELNAQAQSLQDAEIAFLKAQNAYLAQQLLFKNAETEVSKLMFKNLLDNEKLAAMNARVKGFDSGLSFGYLQGKGYDPKQITNLKKGETISFTYTEK